MHVYGPAHLHGPQSISSPHASRIARPAAPSASGSIQDELQISDAAKAVEQTRGLPEMRMDRVREIKAQIAAGTYETPEKMDIALGRLLDEMS